jgi:type I restriction enzyme S subunit
MPKDSIIISTRAPVGYVAITLKESTFNQGCKGLVPKSREILSSFYCYYLKLCKRKLENLSSGSTFKELAKERLENFLIPELALAEQHRITGILGSLDKSIEALRNRQKRLEKIKKGLMDDLLTGRKRVTLEA